MMGMRTCVERAGTVRQATRALAAVLLVILAGCDDLRFPRDPEGTLEAVLATGKITVAAVDHPPWVISNGEALSGAEISLVEDFAKELDVTIEWRRLSAFSALEGLEQGEVDLAIGGFTQSDVSPHAGAAPTYAYFTSTLRVGAAPDAAIPADLAGEAVLVPPDLMASQLVRDEGGVAVDETAPGAVTKLIALPDWQLEARGLVPTEIELRRDRHVIAVPQGENAWVMRLERFLRRASGGMADRLRGYSS
jgi:polar amino acid transport system substrate-binding protein